MKKLLFILFILILITGCKTVSHKVDEVSQKESDKLSKFLNKNENELKIEFGKPDFEEISHNKNRILVYYDSKYKIKCERRFEIDQKSKVVSFTSKNCF